MQDIQDSETVGEYSTPLPIGKTYFSRHLDVVRTGVLETEIELLTLNQSGTNLHQLPSTTPAFLANNPFSRRNIKPTTSHKPLPSHRQSNNQHRILENLGSKPRAHTSKDTRPHAQHANIRRTAAVHSAHLRGAVHRASRRRGYRASVAELVPGFLPAVGLSSVSLCERVVGWQGSAA